jgi:hypothetical protein
MLQRARPARLLRSFATAAEASSSKAPAVVTRRDALKDGLTFDDFLSGDIPKVTLGNTSQ